MNPQNPTVEEIQHRFESISPAPRIANGLQSLIAEGNVNPDEIIALIRLEPFIATRLLREANLLPQSRSTGYASIEEAATALGFQRMYDLLGLYAYPLSQNSLSYSTNAWRRAVTCAACMESLAHRHSLDPQRAYALGLTHSIAEAIIEARVEEQNPTPANQQPQFSRLHNRLRKFSSSNLCSSLLIEWNFPRSMTDPIRFQYSPLDCQTTGKTACLLNLAKWITGVVREVDELPDQALGPDLLVLNLLGEGEQNLWNLVSEVSDTLQNADTFLQGNFSAC